MQETTTALISAIRLVPLVSGNAFHRRYAPAVLEYVMDKLKTVFLDRDGVINELIYYPEHGIIDSPFTVEQFRLLPGVVDAIKIFRRAGYQIILTSNQPGIAKGYYSENSFGFVRQTMREVLAKEGAFLDGEYYCFHHPEAKIEKLKIDCSCRKPKPGLLLQASHERDVDLSQSWMIGDGLTDIQAGKDAGVRAILIGKMKCELCHLIDRNGAKPDAVCSTLLEAAEKITGVKV